MVGRAAATPPNTAQVLSRATCHADATDPAAVRMVLQNRLNKQQKDRVTQFRNITGAK